MGPERCHGASRLSIAVIFFFFFALSCVARPEDFSKMACESPVVTRDCCSFEGLELSNVENSVLNGTFRAFPLPFQTRITLSKLIQQTILKKKNKQKKRK